MLRPAANSAGGCCICRQLGRRDSCTACNYQGDSSHHHLDWRHAWLASTLRWQSGPGIEAHACIGVPDTVTMMYSLLGMPCALQPVGAMSRAWQLARRMSVVLWSGDAHIPLQQDFLPVLPFFSCGLASLSKYDSRFGA